MYKIGVDLGGTNIAAGIVNATGIHADGLFTSVCVDVFVVIGHKNPPMFMIGVAHKQGRPLHCHLMT